MSAIGPGDLVVCVNDAPHQKVGVPTRLRKGEAYRVVDVGVSRIGNPIVGFGEVCSGLAVRWRADRFRKIDRADEGFSTWMRALRPVRRSVDA